MFNNDTVANNIYNKFSELKDLSNIYYKKREYFYMSVSVIGLLIVSALTVILYLKNTFFINYPLVACTLLIIGCFLTLVGVISGSMVYSKNCDPFPQLFNNNIETINFSNKQQDLLKYVSIPQIQIDLFSFFKLNNKDTNKLKKLFAVKDYVNASIQINNMLKNIIEEQKDQDLINSYEKELQSSVQIS
jgi:hypothetical protein